MGPDAWVKKYKCAGGFDEAETRLYTFHGNPTQKRWVYKGKSVDTRTGNSIKFIAFACFGFTHAYIGVLLLKWAF